MNWIRKSIDIEEVKQLSNRYKVDLLTCSILARRRIVEREKVKFYLENDLLFLHSPFEFKDMSNAIERVLDAIESEEKIRVFGDKDVDGITSTVLIVNELNRLGANVSYTVPDGDDPYGMTKEKVKKAKEDGVSLFITVDCGISEIDEINYANDLYIDTIVLDHHLSGEVLPNAYSIIDPKKKGSTYPFEHLAGCGVTAKFIWALRFSQTDYFNEDYILLHAQPGNDTVIIQAMKVRNLVVVDRVIEIINPGLVKIEQSKIIEFINCGVPIIVLDEDVEKKQLSKAFNSKIDIYLQDMRPILNEVFPSLKTKSLFSLSEISKSGKYSEIVRDELDVLMGIFNSIIYSSNKLLSTGFDKVLDLVAIGTVADMMPMVDENRIIVRRGLKQLTQNPRRSLLPLLANAKLINKSITTTNIGWNISPIINSSGRLGKPQVAIDMLLAQEDSKIEEHALALLELNKERQKLGDDSWDKLQKEAKDNFEKFGSKLVLVKNTKVPRGITGLMASRLMNNYKSPSMVLSKNDDSTYTGSMRSPKGFHITKFLKSFDSLLLNFGGHANAGGFSLKEENLDEFIISIEEKLYSMDDVEVEDQNDVEIDCTINEKDFSPKLMKIVELFEPYGQLNNPLVFHIEKAQLSNYFFINGGSNGSRNIKLELSFNNYKWPCIFWNGGKQIDEGFEIGDFVDVVFKMSLNNYKNNEMIQLSIIDIKQSENTLNVNTK
ncbi:MAG: single-stranded-DNA-specific exonuclease RecJ [Pleomorphochaeta sp.]